MAQTEKENVSSVIDLYTDDMTEKFNQAPVFAKSAIVKVVIADEETTVVTTVGNGFTETTNVAQAGDYIVENPSGEKYVLKKDNFSSRYDPTEISGVYKAKGTIQAIKNPYGKSITIKAPWGEDQFGDEECYLASSPNGDRYIIEKEAFLSTYALV